jgi:hypothetical protein
VAIGVDNLKGISFNLRIPKESGRHLEENKPTQRVAGGYLAGKAQRLTSEPRETRLQFYSVWCHEVRWRAVAATVFNEKVSLSD